MKGRQFADRAMDNDTLAKLIVIPLGGLVFLALAVGGFLVVRDTVRQRGKWGINAKQVYCPECGEPAPAIRTPKNRRQALWGGHTCDRCGIEYDKWGDPVKGSRRRRRRRDEPE
jgi:predicted RNA-binding Zn-ribbon protein involved in translation (DUF1610 family)